MKNPPEDKLMEQKELKVFSMSLLSDRTILVETELGYELFNPYSFRLMKRFGHSCTKGYFVLDSHFTTGKDQFLVACRRNNALFTWNKQRCFSFLRRVTVPSSATSNIEISKVDDKLLLLTKLGSRNCALYVWRYTHKELFTEIEIPIESGKGAGIAWSFYWA